VVTARQEIKKEAIAKKEELKLTGEKAKALEEETKLSIEKLMKDSELKKQEYEKKVKELQVELFDYTSYLGEFKVYYFVHFLLHHFSYIFNDYLIIFLFHANLMSINN
jgi:hypothetical protein